MRKKNLIVAIIMTVVSIIYTLMVKYVDVKPIGPNSSEVGFSWINGIFRDLIGSNMIIYKISEVFGIIILLLVVIYGSIGLYQLIKRKNPFKLDPEIIKLGCFYVFVLLVYILFEKVVINYRPIIMDGELEASYPSSHTILSLCVGFSSLIVSHRYFNKKYIKKINMITLIVMLIVLLGRIISGVHWFSDILGGVIISLCLLSWFRFVYYYNK